MCREKIREPPTVQRYDRGKMPKSGPKAQPTPSKGPAPTPKEDPRRLRTRQAILQAAQLAFGTQHPAHVGLDEVLRAAGVSKQTFYNHFEDKNALTQELLRVARATLDAIVQSTNADETDPARRLANAIAVYAAQTLANRPLVQSVAALPLFDLAPNSETNLPVVADIRAGLAQKRLAVCSVDVGLTFITGTTHALVSRLLIETHPQMAVPISTQTITLLLRACGLPPIEAELLSSDAVERVVQPAVAQALQNEALSANKD